MYQKPELDLVVRALLESLRQAPPKKTRRESTVPNKTWREGKCRVMRGIPRDPRRTMKRCQWCMSCPWIQPDGEINFVMLEYCMTHPAELALHMMLKNYPDFGA